jgi:hypothetical protein
MEKYFKKIIVSQKKYENNRACRFQSSLPSEEVSKNNVNICISKSNRGKKKILIVKNVARYLIFSQVALF